jgi:hypothetical protein
MSNPGAVWKSLRMRFGGLLISLDMDDGIAGAIADRYTDYVVEDDTPPDVACVLRADAALAVPVDDRDYPVAQVTYAAGRYHAMRRDLDATITIAPDNRVQLDAVARPTPAAESALRIAVSLALPRRGGLLLHSSGVIEGGRGYVFSGPSGMGKTTTVRLLAPRTPLGDDLVALVIDGDAVRAEATPFAGELGVVAPAGAPLARLYFLEQAQAHERLPLDVAQSRAAILRNTLAYVREPATAGLLQDAAAAIAARVPCARLRFARDPGIAQFLD